MRSVYTIKLFGPQAVRAGTRELRIELPSPAQAGQLLAALGEACPAIQPTLAGSRIAVNHEIAAAEQSILDSDEVALIGMVSGG